MKINIEDHDIQAALDDANRTLEQKSTGTGKYVVEAIEVVWYAYDEDADCLVREVPFVSYRVQVDLPETK